MALASTPDMLHDFTNALERAHLDAPWLAEAMAHTPPRVLPFLWRWTDIEPLLLRTGELMTPGRGAERRVLSLSIPAWWGKPRRIH